MTDQRDDAILAASPDADPMAAASLSMDAFDAALHAQTPRAWVTPLLIAANVIVFGLTILDGVDPLWPNDPQQIQKLLAWGANFPPSTTAGQWWRLASCMFLHIGVLHLGMNMFALGSIAPVTERLCGSVGFLVLYAAAGLVGSLGTLYYALYHTPGVSAGASGAIFGVAGVLLGYVLRQRRTLPPEFVSAVVWRLGMGSVVILAVFQFVPLVKDRIDNAAHVAGFVTGLLGGLVVSRPVSPSARGGRWWRNLLAAVGGGAVVAAGILGYPMDWTEYGDVRARVKRLDDEVTREIETILDAHKQGALSDAEAADRLESDVLPVVDDIAERLDGVDRVKPEDADRLAKDRGIIAEKRAGLIEKIVELRRNAAR